MKPLELALIRQRYAEDGGAERFVARLMETMQDEALRVTLITRAWQEGRGFSVVTVNPFFLGRVWRDWSFARAVCERLAAHRFDIVQSHERISCCDVYRAGDGVHREWLAQRARMLGPLGRLGQRLNPYHIYTCRAERRLFHSPRLRAVICNSKMVRDEIKRHFGLPEDKLPVVYSGVDTALYHPRLRRHRAEVRTRYGIPDAAMVFLFVGSGFVRKGVAVLLEAVAQSLPDTHLIVVGRDKRSVDYEAKAKELGLGARAHFVGAQPDVKPFYGAADALVLPTLYDPFPNVALEAMASGLPVITSTKCGAAELIENGKNGYVCDALDRSALTARLRALTSACASALGAHARASVEHLDLARMGAALAALYRSLLPA